MFRKKVENEKKDFDNGNKTRATTMCVQKGRETFYKTFFFFSILRPNHRPQIIAKVLYP